MSSGNAPSVLSRRTRPLSGAQLTLSGGFAGLFATSLTTPLDVMKIRIQVGAVDLSKGFVGAVRNLFQTDGLRVLWKGNGASCAKVFPYWSITFGTYSLMKKKLPSVPSWATSFAGGACGGVLASFFTYPIDVIKTRLMLQWAKVPMYQGIWDVLVKVYHREGLSALVRGITPTVLGAIPTAGFTFLTYDMLSPMWGSRPRHELPPWKTFITGCISASLGQMLGYPFDLVRRRIQAQGIRSSLPIWMQQASHTRVDSLRSAMSQFRTLVTSTNFAGMRDAFAYYYANGGFRGLFRGAGISFLKVGPYGGVLFMAFEGCIRVCTWYNGERRHPFP